MIKDKQFYLDLFRTSEQTLEQLTEAALAQGGDYADLFFENTTYSDLVLRDGKVSSGGFHVDFGVGIRVLKGEKTGYAYSESTEPGAMAAAARAAAAIAQGSSNEAAVRSIADDNGYVPHLYKGKPNPAADRYPILQDWRQAEAAAFIPLLNRLDERIQAADKRVAKIIAMLSWQVSDVLMYNAFGEMKYETRPMGTLAVSVILTDGKNTVNTHASRSFRCGAEMLTDALADELVNAALRNMDDRFAAKRPKGGKMPVVMGAGASGILLHEAMGHAFEADFNRKGQSVFAGKMGQRICREGITIVDDGTIKGNRGSLNYDDEGVPAQRTCMVEDGILTSYLHDRISARWYGVAPTGNGRRENFRYAPIPRMRATYMESGSAQPADIIASVKKGVFVDEFANGQVKIGEGDFTFYVKSGYLIENGKLTQPVKDINIIGNGPQALADITAVGNDGRIDDGAWTCGKQQSCPVSCGIPTVLVASLTVGGN
ncbi:MAG: TldD/PmbA family protein [Bacteroidales bacterium]|nr:TldD/PmbA family protein [Bacteroidales bacterium]